MLQETHYMFLNDETILQNDEFNWSLNRQEI